MVKNNFKGIVSDVFENKEELQKECMKLAQKISKFDELTLNLTKNVIRSANSTDEYTASKIETLVFNSLFNTTGSKKGIANFMNRRRKQKL